MVDLGFEVCGSCGSVRTSGAAVFAVWLPARAEGVLPLGAVAQDGLVALGAVADSPSVIREFQSQRPRTGHSRSTTALREKVRV